MGIVIDEKEAKGPCVCIELENGKILCHSKGVVGFLSDEQRKKYCYGTYVRPATPQMKEQLRKFAEMSHRCSQQVREEYQKGDRLLPFLDCMSQGDEG